MAETFSPTASLKSTSSHVSVAESPNEYRNLLISISGDKSDHVRWLECLKTFNWHGDGNFEFSLDKCGVPALKNGDYRLNLADECIQMALSKSDKTVMEYKFFWEGNFFDKKVEDAYELTMESMAVVVNKCVQVLRSHGVTKGKPVVLYAPNVLQLPVVLYACAKIGAVLTYVNATINREVGDLVQLFRLSGADLIITVDGFFMGEELQSTKKLVDEVVEKLEEESSQIREILVVRHTGANPAVPPPTESLPRRPFYGLEVPFTEGRDFHWSDLIIDAAIEAEVEWLTAEDILFNTIQKSQITDEWHFESYTMAQIALLAKLLADNFVADAHGPVWPLVETDDLLFLSSIYASTLASLPLLLSEAPPTHPDPSRILQIIDKYKVATLLISGDYAKLLIRSDEFAHLWEGEDDDNQWSTLSVKKVFVTSPLRNKTEEIAEALKKIFPEAEISILFL